MRKSQRLLSILTLTLSALCGGNDSYAQLLLPKTPPPTSSSAKKPDGRFLGWKFAAMAKQDTSGWVRPHTIVAQPSARAVQRPLLQSPRSANANPTVAGFASAPQLPTGFMPTAVVSGDFNEDGKPDVAISNGGDNTVYVYLGKGDGAFAIPEILYTAGKAPVWLADVKLNQTGHIDLIAVDADSQQLEVFSGKGDGTFQPGAIVSLPQTPSFVLAGDFNNDGNPDLAVGLVVAPDSNGSLFTVIPGNGVGGFLPALLPPAVGASFDTPAVTTWLAAGDLNGDGFLDLIPTVAFKTATTYLNQAGTGFQAGNSFAPQNGVVTVALADINNDGCLDAVETDAAGFLTIANGDCHGAFTQRTPQAQLGDVDVTIIVADVNGDGKLDVVASGAFSDAEAPYGSLVGAYGGYLVSVLAGDGSGAFSPAALYRVGSQAYALTVADLKSNGRPDIIALSQQESNASLLTNDGNGGFGIPSGETIGYLNGVWNAPIPYGPVQTVDLNNDGKPDVLLVEYGVTGTMSTQMTALLNQGSGQLSAPIRSPISVVPPATAPLIVAGAFRNASAADVIYVAQNTSPNVVAYMRGNGDGTFATPVTVANVPDPFQVASGDFNHDGKLDFAVWGFSSPANISSQQLDVFLGRGDGTFQQLPPFKFPPLTNALPQQLIAGDFNHDGNLDLLLGNNSNSGSVASGDDLDLALGNGDGTFQSVTMLIAHFGPVAVGDVNHDGYLDLVQARDPATDLTQQALTAAGGGFITPAVTIYLGGPGGKFTHQATYEAPGIQLPSYYPALLGDFDGDGNLDVALPYFPSTISRPWERRLQVFAGVGDGTLLASGLAFQLPGYDQPVVGGDYRGAGLTDLLDLVGATSSINTISAAPSPLLALAADADPLTGSQGSATVTLALPSNSSQTVTLSSSDPAVTLPASVSFSAGQQQQSFSFTVGSALDSSHLLAIYASLAGTTATAYVAARPNPNASAGVTALIGASASGTASVSTSPGASLPLLFTLQSVQGYSGTFSNFVCSGLPPTSSCDFAASQVTLLPGGYAQVAFTINTGSGTPAGTFAVSVAGGNGELNPSAPLTLGIGGFALSLSPSLIQVNAPTRATATVSAAFTNGYNQTVQVACNGLPSGAKCVINSVLYPGTSSEPVDITGAQNVAAQDYPFSITGTAGNLSSTVNATLRVSNFTAALQTNTASLASGKSTTFNIELASINHFSNGNISVSCQVPATVTCATAVQYFVLSDAGTVSVPLTVTYQASGTAAQPKRSYRSWLPVLLLPILLMSSGSRRRTQWTVLLTLMVAVVCAAWFSGCGGGGSGTAAGGTTPAAQTLSVGVTVQANTDEGPLQENAGTITLTVQPKN